MYSGYIFTRRGQCAIICHTQRSYSSPEWLRFFRGTYMYVCNGNLISKTEPHGYRITTGYNGLDMATSINYSNGKELTYIGKQ